MSVTAPLGFRAGGVAAGIKQGSTATGGSHPPHSGEGEPQGGGRDLALVVNDGPSYAAAGVFTRNRVKAAPVLWSQQVLKGGRVCAVVLNSGGANACTGPEGFQDTHATAERVADVLGGSAAEVAVCSTGLIGERLPMDRILSGVESVAAVLSRDGGTAAADAIRTTDTVAKIAFRRGAGYTVGGMAKGAGMLAPSLATMLCVVTTDADLPASDLDRALRVATAVTFDRVDTDGCMSTNDTVLLLASGASGTAPDLDAFTALVTELCADLAHQLVADAEGATKEIAVEVVGAAHEDDALEVGRAVARSNLLKCAIHGEDPNWGRVLAAVGTTRAVFEPDRVGVAINGTWVCRGGAPGEDRAKADMRSRQVTITVNLAAGGASATVWTTDLTAGYVHENSAYSS